MKLALIHVRFILKLNCTVGVNHNGFKKFYRQKLTPKKLGRAPIISNILTWEFMLKKKKYNNYHRYIFSNQITYQQPMNIVIHI